jgi:hypothetical protein
VAAAPVSAQKKPAAPPPPSAAAVQHAASIDSLADAQLKAALK